MSANFKPAAIKPAIAFAAFDRIDVRLGTIISVEDVQGSDKLLKLTVDFGDHRRTILAGMRQERENPRALEGQQALFVINQSLLAFECARILTKASRLCLLSISSRGK